MSENRYLEFDFLRFISIVGVVVIHVTAPFMLELIRMGQQGSPTYVGLVLLNQGARFCVPAFFLISGFFTANGRHKAFSQPGTSKAYIQKRLVRLLLPYFTWTTLLYIMPQLLSDELDIISLFIDIAFGATIQGGYFIIVLSQLTILGPLLLKYVKDHNRIYWILILLSTVITELYFFIASQDQTPFSNLAKVGFTFFLSTFLPWISFYLIGVLVGKDYHKWLHKKLNISWFFVFLGFLLLLGLSISDFYRTYASSNSLNLAASFIKPSSMFYSYFVCAVVLSKKIKGSIFRDTWFVIANSSYGIYLLNGIVLSGLLSITFLRTNIFLGVTTLTLAGIVIPLVIFLTINYRSPQWLRLFAFGIQGEKNL